MKKGRVNTGGGESGGRGRGEWRKGKEGEGREGRGREGKRGGWIVELSNWKIGNVHL